MIVDPSVYEKLISGTKLMILVWRQMKNILISFICLYFKFKPESVKPEAFVRQRDQVACRHLRIGK